MNMNPGIYVYTVDLILSYSYMRIYNTWTPYCLILSWCRSHMWVDWICFPWPLLQETGSPTLHIFSHSWGWDALRLAFPGKELNVTSNNQGSTMNTNKKDWSKTPLYFLFGSGLPGCCQLTSQPCLQPKDPASVAKLCTEGLRQNGFSRKQLQ